MPLMRTLRNDPMHLDIPSRISQLWYRQVSRLSLPSSRRYNLTISHRQSFVWFRVAKAGTRTILNHLRTHNIGLDAEHPSFVHYVPVQYAGYFKFAFVRNPWDRLVSCWLDKVVNGNMFEFDTETLQRMQSFTHFVEYVEGLQIEECDRHLRLQCALVDLNTIDYIGRMETFDADFETICRRLHLPLGEVSRRNVSSGRRPYQEYYDDVLWNRVLNIYRKDCQVFGYLS